MSAQWLVGPGWQRRWGRWIVAALVIAGIAALFTVLGIGLASREPVTGRSGITRVDKPAPRFEMTTFDGARFVLADHIGQPMVINFWASWCIPCLREAPILEDAWRAARGVGVLFVGVDIDDAEQDARRFIEEFGVTYPNGLDPDGEITVDYGVIGLPVTFFVNREGVIERRWVGEISGPQLASWLDDLVSGRTPDERYGENRDAFFEIGEPAQ